MDRETAPRYIRENFSPSDRLAVVLIQKRADTVTQRLSTAERIASPTFQAWLRHQNASKNDVYISMNTVRADAFGRTKNDIDAVRHAYLDFDTEGTEAVERLLSRSDVPQPNYRVNSSPGKWQVSWKVEGFSKEQAETLLRWLARDTGADPAATDSARVMRLPGFYNHKYSRPHLVTVEKLNDRIYTPSDFPTPPIAQSDAPPISGSRSYEPPKAGLSQSERDWAFAKRALARGEREDLVTLAIAVLRKGEKHDAVAYAQRTVQRAALQLAAERNRAVESFDR